MRTTFNTYTASTSVASLVISHMTALLTLKEHIFRGEIVVSPVPSSEIHSNVCNYNYCMKIIDFVKSDSLYSSSTSFSSVTKRLFCIYSSSLHFSSLF